MTPPELDQLIEEGLTLYGQGDLDGALLAWEKALAVDPDNAQANSYVDYVRQNYELLTGEIESTEPIAPFGIDEEPYQIEIVPGELQTAAPKKASSAVDEGWFMDDESAPRRSLELDPIEPAAGDPTAEPTTSTAPLDPSALDPFGSLDQLELAPVNFEDETREYQSAQRAASQRAASQPDSGRAEFGDIELTPSPGFSSQPTNLRDRDTGFVKPTQVRPKSPSQAPSELKVTLRSPEPDNPFATMSIPRLDNLPSEPAPASASISLSYDDPPTTERTLSPEAADLINSLPSPTPRAAPAQVDQARTGTAELPPAIRPPATGEMPSIALPAALTRDVRTRDFEAQPTKSAIPKPGTTVPTRDLPLGEVSYHRDIVSAPTRDLGLRPLGVTGTAVLPEDKTSQHKPAPPVGEGTRADVILPFDPIDARSAQILDEVEEGAPPLESPEDRTRRRITTLFDKALAWSQSGELDKAVASIDLALSEDPNSALGQKLIHRHRDQMLSVFQAFLGDLDRQPVLARPLHELASAPISPRAAFLLSRIDGTLTLDELLDVSGMPRIEAYRYLCQLFLRGILK